MFTFYDDVALSFCVVMFIFLGWPVFFFLGSFLVFVSWSYLVLAWSCLGCGAVLFTFSVVLFSSCVVLFLFLVVLFIFSRGHVHNFLCGHV